MRIDNTQDIIDSRDVIERIEELENDENLDNGEIGELKTLKDLAEEASGYASDWEYGEALIRDSYFRTYAEEQATNCCEMPNALRWPYTHIDWQSAAKELKIDYSIVEFDGVDYYIR